MDNDFSIEVFAPKGHEALRPHLPSCPFPLTIEWSEEANTGVLVQDRVSPTTGFFFEAREGDSYLYGACGADRDIEGLSAVLRAAGMSHHIERVRHELDTDDEFIAYLDENDGKPERWLFSRG
ncbi:hypothetical protein [Variovorax paradoxus]|jgi:hypothetical protein|uniref:Uncharacterized protein n=1 Tax=Variovorax paradoxus TaxID=34073 RepID=A0A6I6H4Z1_VARPD|nr:hypothetical protein [Variovorax paradoxus]QGW81933.1 hypothetical protein GOQ09_10160 [Variovorax paradoxus]